ncbi:hypothetical protein BDZ97DRAFT_1911974 [Flammula alnicola]|nr:hypothetical protein BDZ97DRAFT_1911974 [Flammula alnicola]
MQVDIKDYYTATLLESRTTIESGTTGLRTWLASFVLSQYLILHPNLVTSKRILELGSGIGFLGIIVASLQQLLKTSELPASSETGASLWLTDINDEVLARCRDNVNLPCNISFSHRDVNYLKLDWFESLEEGPEHPSPLAALIHEQIDPELILGADVNFDPFLIPALVGTLKIALQPLHPSITPKLAIMPFQ